MKTGPIVRIVAVVVVGAAAITAIRWFERLPSERLAALLGLRVTISDLSTPTPTPTGSSLPIADRVPELSLGTVAIQTYAGSVLVRSAAGTVVASDGLIVTTAAAAPYGSGSYLYQVTTATGTVSRARRVASDPANGLVLLKVETTEVGTVPFVEDARMRSGDELSAIGATVVLSRYTPVTLPVAVAYALDERTVALSLDRTYLNLLTGSRVVDSQGSTVGLLRPGTTVGVIGAAAVNAFIDRYLHD